MTPAPTLAEPGTAPRGRWYGKGSPAVLFTSFDVAAYTREAAGRIEVDKAAVDAFDERLAADLSFLWRLDSAGLSETRAVLSSWTGNEARITAFIATWSYERMWLAWAVRDLLTASGVDPQPRIGSSLRARARDLWVERALPIVAPPVTSAIGERSSAGHMLRLALQEAHLQSAYRAVLPRLSGEAARVVSQIVERRDRIIEFFELEASARIARSRGEWLAARCALLGWRPLRIVGVPDPDEDRALASIFAKLPARERLASVDLRIRGLLNGVGLIRGADRDGGPAPAPSPGLFTPRRNRGI